ncbi:MAG: CatA-like O-acetyltransferase [Planctomycetaceae bacterium]|nr:CatA-like O-acetyltransferase [Planctomycetaceae bacterium]
MKTIINLETWNRAEHYNLFRKYDVPFWSVSTNLDVTHAYRWCKEHGRSFSTAYHWASAKAINEIDALKMRIENNLPVLFDTVHVSTTIARPDGTFGFSFTPFDADFESFHEALKIETQRVKAETGLKSPYSGIDILYYTVLRKVKFTMLEHAHGLGDGAAIPFLAFGESFEENGRLLLPHSLRIHHSLVDGQHVGLYYERLEEILKEF